MFMMRHWAFLGLLALISCSPPEQQVITRYLTAVQSGDENLAGAMSLATFPAEVASWEVLEAGPETKELFNFVEMRDRVLETQKAFDEAVKRNDAFLQENQELAIEYRSKTDEDPDYEFTSGKMAEFQQEWERRLEEQNALQEAARTADEEFQQLKKMARMSCRVGVTEHHEGDVSVKKVNVRVDEGSGPETYTFTLRKFNLVDTENNITPMSNWIITEIAPQET